ncbi:phospholipase A2 group XV, partial [Nephila pilipes]
CTHHVPRHSPLSSVSGGSSSYSFLLSVRLSANGENLGFNVISPLYLRIEQRTAVSHSYMLPSRQLWSPNEVIAFTKYKNYTVKNYDEFFRDIGFSTAFEMYKDTFRYAEKGLNPPGVEVHCFFGTELETMNK